MNEIHEVFFRTNRTKTLCLAQCSCGWHAAGSLDTVQCMAASHDLDEPQEAKNGDTKNDDR